MNRKVIFIVGPSHSGSTLLDLMLGSHSRAFSLGELHQLPNRLESQLCGVCAGHCDFWDERVSRQILSAYVAGAKSPNRFRREWYQRLGSVRRNIYRYLMDISGKEIMVDSSKTPTWARRQLRPWWHWREMTPYFIFIHRDGRAVTNSFVRKYPQQGMEYFAQAWVKNIKYLERTFQDFPAERRMIVAYEELATAPAATMERVCTAIGETFEPEMVDYWRHEHHATGGNIGPRRHIFSYRERFGSDQSEFWNAAMGEQEYYRKMGLGIKLDLRWQQELAAQDLATFDRIAGHVNERYAWDGEGQVPEPADRIKSASAC